MKALVLFHSLIFSPLPQEEEAISESCTNKNNGSHRSFPGVGNLLFLHGHRQTQRWELTVLEQATPILKLRHTQRNFQYTP